ncbi:MAG TPA: hypothetical protein VEV65_12305 [Kineosporiaceae bacterium]|nr:hypothetical protein [Kineosporiaceae bacterium]
MADDDAPEVLDLGVLNDPAQPGPRPPGLPRRALFTLGGAAALGVGVTLVRSRTSVPAPDARTPVVVSDLNRPLLAGPPVDVFGSGEQEVVRVEAGTGRVTRTYLPGVADVRPDLVPVDGGVLVHRGDDGRSWLVPDGQPARPVPALQRRGPMLPGPDLGHVWLMSGSGPNAPLMLVGLDGLVLRRGVGVSAQLSSYPVPDGTGYPLFFGLQGVYRAGPRGLRRVTTGAVLANGPRGWLVLECDEQSRCSTVLVRRGGTRSPVGISPTDVAATIGGALSPDGRRVALYLGTAAADPGLILVDLVTEGRLRSDTTLAPGASRRSLRWSPDGAALLTVASPGRVVAVDPGTGRSDPLLPESAAVAVRDIAIRA